jgi:hypothetical protein
LKATDSGSGEHELSSADEPQRLGSAVLRRVAQSAHKAAWSAMVFDGSSGCGGSSSSFPPAGLRQRRRLVASNVGALCRDLERLIFNFLFSRVLFDFFLEHLGVSGIFCTACAVLYFAIRMTRCFSQIKKTRIIWRNCCFVYVLYV